MRESRKKKHLEETYSSKCKRNLFSKVHNATPQMPCINRSLRTCALTGGCFPEYLVCPLKGIHAIPRVQAPYVLVLAQNIRYITYTAGYFLLCCSFILPQAFFRCKATRELGAIFQADFLPLCLLSAPWFSHTDP